MHSEGLWDSPEADCHSSFDTLGHGYLPEAAVHAIHAYHARNRVAEPDFEIGQERKCLRSRGQRRETSFSRSRSRGAARRKGPQTAAKRTGSSNPTRKYCYIKDYLAEGVGFELSVRFYISL